MINQPDVQVILIKLQEIYAYFLPIQLLQGGCYATARSIGRQNDLIYGQILSNYIVHFSVLGFLLSSGYDPNSSIAIACAFTYTALVLYGFGLAFIVDWDEASKKLIMELNIKNTLNKAQLKSEQIELI